MSQTRPRAKRFYGEDFIAKAKELGYDKNEATNVWQRLVRFNNNGTRYARVAALEEYMTWGQIVEASQAGQKAFRGMSDHRWSLVARLAKELERAF